MKGIAELSIGKSFYIAAKIPKFFSRASGGEQEVRNNLTPDEFIERIRQANNEDWVIPVGNDRAKTVSAVYACCNVLSETLAQLPMAIFQEMPDNSTRRAMEHPYYRLVARRPNKRQSPFVHKENAMQHNMMCGNSYDYLDRREGEIRQIVPLDPDKVKPHVSERYGVVYEVKGMKRNLTDYNVLHIRGPIGMDGITGMSPITQARRAISMAWQTESFGGRMFKNRAILGGVLQMPGKLDDDRKQELGEKWDEQHSGENAYTTKVLEMGAKWTPMAMSAEDAQFISTRTFTVIDIARFFNLQPHKIQELTRSTFTNIEHQSTEFFRDTMMPWIKRFEEAYTHALLTEAEQDDGYYVGFIVDGLIKGDIETENSVLMQRVKNRVITRNEARSKIGMAPIEGGDTWEDVQGDIGRPPAE